LCFISTSHQRNAIAYTTFYTGSFHIIALREHLHLESLDVFGCTWSSLAPSLVYVAAQVGLVAAWVIAAGAAAGPALSKLSGAARHSHTHRIIATLSKHSSCCGSGSAAAGGVAQRQCHR
jgi:hypothetical protein